MSEFIIPETLVQKAFDLLRSSDHAVARAAFDYSERNLKVVLARAAAASNASSAAQRESDAYRSLEYSSALEAFRSVAEEYYRLRDKREAAAALIEAWRTQQSDRRSMARVA